MEMETKCHGGESIKLAQSCIIWDQPLFSFIFLMNFALIKV